MGLLQHTSVTVLARWSAIVFDGVTSIVVARSIGPAGKGTLAVLGVIAGLAMQMGNFGFPAGLSHAGVLIPACPGFLPTVILATLAAACRPPRPVDAAGGPERA